MRMAILVVRIVSMLSISDAYGQVAPIGAAAGPSPLGITSPLGIGPGLPVAPTGIPLGAVELGGAGVSPGASSTLSVGSAGSDSLCAGFDSAIPQASFGSTPAISGELPNTPEFDGGGITGHATGTCAPGGAATFARVQGSASSPTGIAPGSKVGEVGIPLGSTELGAGGLSPPPTDPIVNPVTTTSPLGGM